MATAEKQRSAGNPGCDYCSNLVYDQELDEYYCDAVLDEDDVEKLFGGRSEGCPYFRSEDDYKLARRQ